MAFGKASADDLLTAGDPSARTTLGLNNGIKFGVKYNKI
jgi:hypothetical protein